MNVEIPSWFEILHSLLEEDTGDRIKVTDYKLTEHLSNLYEKIEELERRLDKQEEYQQEQNV